MSIADQYLALLSTKVVPGPYGNPSPAPLMFKQAICSIIPTIADMKQKQVNKKEQHRTKLDESPHYCLPLLKLNDKVRL